VRGDVVDGANVLREQREAIAVHHEDNTCWRSRSRGMATITAAAIHYASGRLRRRDCHSVAALLSC
jgi:hypothetical protein